MTARRDTPHSNLTPALEAINNLAAQELNGLFNGGQMAAMMAHDEIDLAPINLKTGIFYRHLVPLRQDLVSALAKSYRRCFKLALAHPLETGGSPEQWAWSLIQPAINATLERICDWYILACDGENRNVQHIGEIPFVPGGTGSLSIPLTAPAFPPLKSWRAPAWLFQVSPTLGFLLLRTEHVPANDSEERLSAAHTRLLLRAARRSFLWQLGASVEIVRDEEIAASGAIPAQIVGGEHTQPKKSKHWLRGTEGLGPKSMDLSKYMDGLTEKQQLAFSLKCEYGLKLGEIASRMGLDRKTAYEHIEAAQRKIDQGHSNEKRKAHAKNTPDS